MSSPEVGGHNSSRPVWGSSSLRPASARPSWLTKVTPTLGLLDLTLPSSCPHSSCPSSLPPPFFLSLFTSFHSCEPPPQSR